MTLKTVRVPSEMEALFARAEEVVSRFFRDRRDDPARGTIEIFGERYLLIRAASLSVEFFSVLRDLYGPGRQDEADDFARNILYDLAHAIGRSDARDFHAKMKLEDPIARLSAGPVHFAHAGWAFVDILPESRAVRGEEYCLVYDHPYSFESDAWIRAGESHDLPVCIMNSGYSSGWCAESFDLELVATEILCRARGDETCRFVMAQPARIEEYVQRYVRGAPGMAARVRGYSIPDLFARKRMEEELRRSRDELEERVAQRTRELRREMAERAEVERKLQQAHKLEALGRLVGGIAHDFNNLMAVVLGRTSLLERRLPPDDPARAELAQITAAVDRASGLTRQLLAFGRAQLGAPEILDITIVVAELVRTLVPLIGEDIELVTDLGRDVGSVEADRGQLEQVVMNLVVNARDAMPRGGVLRLETRAATLQAPVTLATGTLPPGDYVLLSVADTGAGMDQETVAKIFDPFFTTKPDGQGTGLGLSTVYGIVQKARGAVGVETRLGEGSRFDLYLPRATRARPPEGATDRAGTAPTGTETILLVEDQSELRDLLEEVLATLGYRVLSAPTPTAALALVEQHAGRIDLLVTDVVMPKMSGYELARQIGELRQGIRVLYMSGYAPEQTTHGEGEGPPSSLLSKPFDPHELAVRIRSTLDGEG